MSKWEMVRLGNLFKITSGGTPAKSRAEYYENGTVQWVRTGDLKDKYIKQVDGLISEEALKGSSAKLFPAGTVLLAMYGATIGACSILAIEAATNQACAVFVPNPQVNNSYLYYFLHSQKQEFIKLSVGGAQPNISGAILKKIKIPLPPLEVQQKIAQTLDAAAALLALRKEQLKELDKLIKAVFYEMFGDPVTNEKGWDVKCLGSITQIATGGTPSRACEDYYSGGTIPWIKTGEVHGSYITSVEERITALAVKETNCKIMPRNTILIAMYGQGKTRGQVGMLQIDGATNQACAAILPNGDFSSEYLFRLLNINYQTLRDLGRGGNQPNLNLNIVKKFPVLFPPVYIQTQFAEIVTKIEEQKVLVQKAIDESQYLFDSLMNEYFN